MKIPLNTRPAAGRAAWNAGIAAALLAVSGLNALAGAFTPGNLVVERLGDGTQILTNTGNTIFLDEITSNGVLVQSIQIPNTGGSALLEAGGSSAGTEGGMTLAGDGKSLVFPGYNAALPFSSQLITNISTAVPRGIGKLDASGNYTLAASSTTGYSGSSFRGAASDGTNNFWGSGTYISAANPNGGIWYFGNTSPQVQIYYPTHTANLRCANVINGSLWFSTASSTGLGYGIWEFAGLPTAVATPTRIITTTSADSLYNFSVSPDGAVIYYSDDGSLVSLNAGIHKWTKIGGIYSSNVIFSGTPCYGLTVDWTTIPATLYTTTGSGSSSNSLIKITDIGPGSMATVLANTGTSNKIYRGVSFAPAAVQPGSTPVAPSISGITPPSLLTNAGSSVSFVLTGTTGTPISSNYWYQVTGVSPSLTTNLVASGSSAAGAPLIFTNLQPGNAGNYFAVLSNASGSVTSSIVALTVTNTPNITSISPSGAFTNNVGTTVNFTLVSSSGYPAASNFWYVITGASPNLTNSLIAGATATSLTITNLQLTNAGSYYAVLSNSSGSITSSIATMGIFIPVPTIAGITPTNSITVAAGGTVPFVLNSYRGSPVASNFWYKITPTSTNVVSTAFNFTLTNVGAGDSASYYAILTNIYGFATSSVVNLTVTGDPSIVIQPASAQGLVNATVQFAVLAGGTSPSYQWYFSDATGNLVAPVGQIGDGSVLSGAQSNILTFASLKSGDLTNFVVVVTNIYGAVTSTVASVWSGTNLSNGGLVPYVDAVIALWDFDGPQFTNQPYFPSYITSPVPFIGIGAASAIGTCLNLGGSLSASPANQSPFAGATDPNDVGYDPIAGQYVFTPYGFEQPSPNGSWGTDNYPINGTNKQNGVQFNVSTAGARNIRVAYDSRVSGTASEYERLQFTTNGTTWIDYPASSTFSGLSGSGDAGYYPFSYSLVGFPGVDDNPNFGIRIVTEWQSTATYQTAATSVNTNILGANGVIATNAWVGTANSYTSGDNASSNAVAGTVTYDVVAILGDAITNNNAPPMFGSFNLPVASGMSFTNMVDTNTITLDFSASSLQMPASNLTFTVQSLDTVAAGYFPRTVDPVFVVTNTSSTNFQLAISFPFHPIPDPLDAAPILVTATDTNGLSAATWFTLNVSSINQPPTNSLTSLQATNLLANSALTIPFTVGSMRNPNSSLTFSVSSGNNTLIPFQNIVLGGDTNAGNLTVTITPAPGQVGDALVHVGVSDNDPQEPRTTTANIAVIVRPNPNVVAVDYFNYDTSGPLDTIAAGYWQHLSGVNQQLQAGNGVATVSGGNTENLQAQLLGSPNSSGFLYASFTVNMSPSQLPVADGSYFTAFNDGSGTTANVEDCVVAATNGVATPNTYRLGIANFVGATGANAQMVPMDLTPGVTYFVITALELSSGHSTLWISPTNQSSASTTDTSSTTVYPISDFELRESGATIGAINVGNLIVGTAFNSVFYPPQANPDIVGAVENSTNVLSPLLNDGGSELQVASVSETDGNGTATTNGTTVLFQPALNFLGAATVNYTLVDDMGNTSNSVITITVTNYPPLALPDAFNVASNSINNVLSPLANDAVRTPGGVLSLVGVNETDGNGTASVSGNQVLFTPVNNFAGMATIPYMVTDGIGGTSSSFITVTVGSVPNTPLSAQLSGGSFVLSWTNSPFAFSLQFSTNVAGPYITIPGATSPYTNMNTTGAAGFYRLVH